MPYTIADQRWFINELLPRLHGNGEFFVQEVPGKPPRIYSVAPDGTPNEIHTPEELAAVVLCSKLMSEIDRAPRHNGPPLPQLCNQAARAYMMSTRAQLSHPDAVYKYIITTPTILYHNGTYVRPNRGFDARYRSYSTVDQFQPVPVTAPRLFNWVCKRLQLDKANSARLLAWYCGILLRANFAPFPALLLRSPYKGTGKSCAARLAQYMVNDEAVDRSMKWQGDQEFSKILCSKDANSPFIWIDNIDASTKSLCSENINAATQNGALDLRILGKAKMTTIASPSFALTLQGGRINHDLMDRLLIVTFDKPAPRSISPKDNLQLFATSKFRALRRELLSLILHTQPLPENFQWKSTDGATSFRFPEFFRFVAPVVKAAKLNPADLVSVNTSHDAREEFQELIRLLAVQSEKHPQQWFTAADLVAKVAPIRYPALGILCSASLPVAAAVAAMKLLLRDLPLEVNDGNITYRIAYKSDGNPGAGRAYRAATSENNS